MPAEASNRAFFARRVAERLVDPARFTADIDAFLEAERRIIATMVGAGCLLVDVGCSSGRHLDVAVGAGTEYLGVDIAPRLLEGGRRRVTELGLAAELHRFVEGDACALPDVLRRCGVDTRERDALIVLGFSLLSAIEDWDAVATALRDTQARFVATVYRATDAATAMRLRYYRACGYDNTVVSKADDGVWLTAPGYRTVAPTRESLVRLWSRRGLDVEVRDFSECGRACISAQATRQPAAGEVGLGCSA